jgi:hypothetical protein
MEILISTSFWGAVVVNLGHTQHIGGDVHSHHSIATVMVMTMIGNSMQDDVDDDMVMMMMTVAHPLV